MAVKIGSARIDENGRTTGGKAGDQTGNEVGTQSWYAHSKGWRVFRAKDAAKRDRIAAAMEHACANSKIGYDQNERSDLYNAVKNKGFDPANATEKTETDCSALVRVCCAYAGIMLSDFNTSTEPGRLAGSGSFSELTDGKYTGRDAYLCRGDILVTRTKGHTVIVLTDGELAGREDAQSPRELGGRILRNGAEGDDVRELQTLLIQLGYDCGRWGADGDFGDATEMAVEDFQTDYDLLVDGEVGEETTAALLTAVGGDADAGAHVRIVGGNCYVRNAPNTDGKKLGTAHADDVLPYQGKTSADGWLCVRWRDTDAWVSGKYGRTED